MSVMTMQMICHDLKIGSFTMNVTNPPTYPHYHIQLPTVCPLHPRWIYMWSARLQQILAVLLTVISLLLYYDSMNDILGLCIVFLMHL